VAPGAHETAAGVRTVELAPSILSADFAHLAKALGDVDQETDRVHIDVMDGHFVPNLTLGPPLVAAIRPCSTRPFECHLMLTDPGAFLAPFREAGADACTVHVEVGDTPGLVAEARRLGLRVGLACNPETPVEAVLEHLGLVDLVLCMTVHPGFGGQAFLTDVLDKVRAVRDELDRLGLEVDVEVDGGVDHTTAPLAVAAGANVLVAGSAIFGATDPLGAAAALRAAATA
jgi:ribulose-phosphate 3-epimerase